jgi:hypothetical protein
LAVIKTKKSSLRVTCNVSVRERKSERRERREREENEN